MKYKIKVIEVLSKIVEVEAANEYEALEIAEEMYCDEIIVLDYNDFDYVDYLIKED